MNSTLLLCLVAASFGGDWLPQAPHLPQAPMCPTPCDVAPGCVCRLNGTRCPCYDDAVKIDPFSPENHIHPVKPKAEEKYDIRSLLGRKGTCGCDVGAPCVCHSPGDRCGCHDAGRVHAMTSKEKGCAKCWADTPEWSGWYYRVEAPIGRGVLSESKPVLSSRIVMPNLPAFGGVICVGGS